MSWTRCTDGGILRDKWVHLLFGVPQQARVIFFWKYLFIAPPIYGPHFDVLVKFLRQITTPASCASVRGALNALVAAETAFIRISVPKASFISTFRFRPKPRGVRLEISGARRGGAGQTLTEEREGWSERDGYLTAADRAPQR